MSLHVLCITRGFKCWCVRKFKSDRVSVVGLRKWSKHQSKVPSHTSLLKQAIVLLLLFVVASLAKCKIRQIPTPPLTLILPPLHWRGGDRMSMTLYLMDLGNRIKMWGWSTRPTFLSSSRSVLEMGLQTLLLMNEYLSVRICLMQTMVGTKTNDGLF